MPLAARVALRVLLCSVVGWLGWRWNGAVGLVTTIPIWGVMLAGPLIEAAGEWRHRLRAAAWKPVQGRHYAFHGVHVQVLEDEWHRRWVRAADVRRIVGTPPHGGASDHALALTYPDGWRLQGQPPEPHFSDEALVAHLAKETSPKALRFRHWVERDILFPAKRQRERFGVRTPPPGASDRD